MNYIPPCNDGSVKGRLHSSESGGMVDGPGIRYILFLQGCPLRCLYCHNPDTWKKGDGFETDSSGVLREVLKYKRFMQAAKGGLTISGGEALFQPDFTIDIIKKAKAAGIHTAVDTSGYCAQGRAMEVLELADLVLLDLKMLDPAGHKKLTGVDNNPIMETAKLLAERGIPVWIRHVIVPGITDQAQELKKLMEWISELGNVEKVELLPYHNLGQYKWEELGLKYTLEDVSPPEQELMKELNEIRKSFGF